jgi:hypothetical protein
VSFDLTQLDQLSADLGRAPQDAGPKIYKAFTVTSARIKKDWQRKLSGTPGVPHGSLTITYDVGSSVTGPLGVLLRSFGIESATTFNGGKYAIGGNHIASEIGAEDGRPQAPIVAVEEFGSPGQNLPPHGYGTASLQDNEDDFVNGLLLAIGDPLGVSTEHAPYEPVGQIAREGGVV